MSSFSLSIKTHGFAKGEILQIKATNLFDVFVKLGLETSKLAKNELGSKTSRKYRLESTKALNDFSQILTLVQKGVFKIGDTDFGKHYLQSLLGYAQGSGLTLAEVCLLQKEIAAGCQTVIRKNQNGDIGFFHTEENSADDNRNDNYNYRLVNLKFPGKNILYFAYPGQISWGSAFGIDQKNTLAVLTDDLLLENKFAGPLWRNMIGFMLLDAGSLDKAQLLMKKIARQAQKYGFDNGYAIHLIQAGQKPRVTTYEIGGKLVKTIRPHANTVQVNFPNHPDLQKMSSLIPPRVKSDWDSHTKQTYLEMINRIRRLSTLCQSDIWQIDETNAVKTGLHALAYPYGDLRRYKTKGGKWNYYHTGLPSIWTFAHVVGFISNKSKIYIGKNTPNPIANMSYDNYLDQNYRFAEEKLWEKV